MKLANKILIAAAVVLMVVGVLIMVGTTASKGFSLTLDDFNTATYEKKEYKFTDKINNIDIDGSVAEVEFFVKEGDSVEVEVNQTNKIQFDVNVKGDTLSIKCNKEHGFHFFDIASDVHIYIYLPTNTLDKIEIDSSTGAIRIPDLICNDIEIDISTGETTLKGTVINNELKIDSSTGGIALKDVTAGNMDIDVSTGAIEFDNCEAGEIIAHASTGSISGTLKGDYLYDATSSTGSVNVPGSNGTRRCRLSASTGSIDIKKAK